MRTRIVVATLVVMCLSLLAASLAAAMSKTSASPVRLVGVFATNMLGTSAGGYMLYSNGRLAPLSGAPYYGNAVATKLNNFVGMVTDANGNGYWLVTSTGKSFGFGPGPKCSGKVVGPTIPAGTSIAGAINSSGFLTGTYEMVSSTGKIYKRTCTIFG